jgi:hypothetical protein
MPSSGPATALPIGEPMQTTTIFQKMPIEASRFITSLAADSDDAAHLFRSDRAHHSELMPPGRECLIDGLVCH